MKICYLILFTLLLHHNARSQNASAEIVGKWKVVQVVPIDVEELGDQQIMDMFVNALKKAVFHFGADQKFSFLIEIPELAIPSATWKMGKKADTITVFEKPAGNKIPGLLMEIAIQKKDDKTFFVLIGTPLVLQVVKQQ